MGKNTISTFSLILLIAAVMFFFHVNREAEKRAAAQIEEIEQTSIVAEMPRPAATTTTTPKAPVSPTPSRQAELASGELQNLEQQLAQAQADLQVQRESVNQLATQSQSFTSRMPAALGSFDLNVLRSESQVQNALMEIDAYRNLEQQINRQAEDQMRIQNSAAQAQLAQIDESIRAQELQIRQTREDIMYWNQNFNDQTRRMAELQRLQEQLDALNQQRDLMLQQRLLIAAESLSAAQALQAGKQEALNDLQSNQANAQGNIESLRDSIIRLQQSQREIRNSQISLGSQLRQAQQALQSQETQVKSLETAVEQKRQELNSLVQ
ncbi:hypothetical protein AZI86_15390 [Bdellovibrio bacteriovorus]|uniref:Uncharacterized protein n=1 Tax=Bdellovibrio bacteriovorus TaxID=959 RepID=A0A150WHF6_BDEBC|nr:hypothetical protein [Bdellovibrio bacteriovorus]KYG63102.1 hypothetical protein AZI86_15390 [Bdellovibrio bacteriovorus]